jgi:hypothetical protein
MARNNRQTSVRNRRMNPPRSALDWPRNGLS